MKKAKRTTATTDAAPAPVVVALPRPDVTDAEIVSAIAEAAGLPTRVADKFGMTFADLMTRAKASREIAAAFAEARQRMVDVARAHAFKIAVGDSATPPDPTMLRWIIKHYE